MTSAWLGEYFIMDPYTNTGVFAHLVIIEDEDFNEVFAYFECIEYVMPPMPTRPPPM